MPKGFTDDGRPLMTKDEFVEQFKYDLEVKAKKESNTKVTSKDNKKTKKSTTTSDKKDERLSIAEIFANEYDKQGYTVETEKATITIKNQNATYELKIVKKAEPYELSDYNGTKDAMKNKLIRIALEIQYKNFTIETVDKTGLVGLNDGTTFYTAKFTKKKV